MTYHTHDEGGISRRHALECMLRALSDPTRRPKDTPHQWLKNLLVFVPMVAAPKLAAETIGHSLLAFIALTHMPSSPI
jgi:hypothetical protein